MYIYPLFNQHTKFYGENDPLFQASLKKSLVQLQKRKKQMHCFARMGILYDTTPPAAVQVAQCAGFTDTIN